MTRKLFEALFNEKFGRVRLAILNKLELDGYCENLKLAFEYDGAQHYQFKELFHKTPEDFKNQQNRDLLKDQLCQQNNITLIRIPYTVKYHELQEFITAECIKRNIVIPNNNKIDPTTFSDIYRLNENKYNDLKQAIENRGGTILTDVYISITTFFDVKCSNHHTFRTNGDRIKLGHWCPFCAKNKLTILDMQEMASRMGGFCLSDIYINRITELKWKCQSDHIWYENFSNISRRQHFCKKCKYNKKPKQSVHTIQDVQ